MRLRGYWVTLAGSVVTSSTPGPLRCAAPGSSAAAPTKSAWICFSSAGTWTRCRWTSTFPASILEMSRMSLISARRSLALRWTRSRLSRCWGSRRLPSAQRAPVKPESRSLACAAHAKRRPESVLEAEACWSSRAVRASRLRWSSSTSFCSVSRRELLADALVRGSVGQRHGEARSDHRQRVDGPGREARVAPSASTPTVLE